MTNVFRKGYRVLSPEELATVEAIKDTAQALWDLYDKAPSREASIAKTDLESSVMWAVKAVTG